MVFSYMVKVALDANRIRRRYRNAFNRLKEDTKKLNKECELLPLLALYLIPLKQKFDAAGAERERRHVVLKIVDWPEQHKFGIVRCCGFKIDWES